MVSNGINGLKIGAFIFAKDYKYLLGLSGSLIQDHLKYYKLIMHYTYNLNQEHMDSSSF